MNPMILALVAIRSAALALAIAGDTSTSSKLYLLADAIEAGKATDEHMQAVADKLKAGEITDEDWADVLARIDADYARLQGS